MKWEYKSFDLSGRPVAGAIDAANAQEAFDLLRKIGCYATEVHPSEPGSGTAARGAGTQRSRGTGRNLRNLGAFTRQLHVLIASGTPLVDAMAGVGRQITDPYWRSLVETLRTKVESGSTLADAVAGHPGEFDSVAHSLIAAGEQSGTLAPMLERLSLIIRKRLVLRNTVVGAMVYPCVLTLMGVAVVLLMLLFVLPRFADLFKTLDCPLPPMTRWLTMLSAALQSNWIGALAGVAAGITLGIFGVTHGGVRRLVDRFILRVPRLGHLVRALASARLARLLGALVESHVPLVESLRLVRGAMANVHYVRLVASAEEALVRGEPASAVLSTSDLLSPSVQEAIRTGEQSGKMGAPLLQIAEFLDEENETAIKALTSLIEPLILAALGVFVGAMAISVFLPLFDLVASVGGGSK